jgi:hypothetical protein
VDAGACVVPSDAGYWDDFIGAYDCGNGTTCAGATCVVGCLGDFDCPNGEDCGSSGCSPGCDKAEDCCLGQLCQNGACVTGTGVSSFPLCDTSSCTSNACDAANGGCIADFDQVYGCVPYVTSDATCAKGYSWEPVPTVVTPCSYQGTGCVGGRSCSATLDSPNGTCSCLGQADCPSGTSCSDPLNEGVSYCYSPGAVCAPDFQCGELTFSASSVCDDTY